MLGFAQRFSKIVLDITASPFKPDHWDVVLQEIAVEMMATKASMHMHEFKGDTWTKHIAGARLHSIGYAEAAAKEYRDYFAVHDPYVQGIRNLGPGTGVGTSDALITPEALRGSEFYADYGRPNGIFFVSWMLIEQNERFASGLAMIRPERSTQFALEQVEFLRILSPHLEQAFTHQRLIRAWAGDGKQMLDSVDKAGIALIGFDERGRIKNTSKAAEVLLKRNDPIRLRNGRIKALDPKKDTELQSALASTSCIWQDVRALESNTIRLPSRDGSALLEIRIFPFSPAYDCVAADSPLFSEDRPRTVAYLFERQQSKELVQQIRLNFSPTEERIASLLRLGKGQSEIATRLNMKPGSLRQHLFHMYQKADIRRPGSQAKLVHLLLAGG